ncbi:ABC transporter substrate-binding protein [Nakamurella leprariae]|uniref:ABC transporter substrate-binding protein n=1 Tax=Nakamurella leprariae TaxID=2803911 RepID=A0A939C110_9ACTN|nr:ABC transporter substrate-binding protein [Nakamurella leprariae]MBM9466692.1 ABC transporter substrate-binding protein [Nakamurella leprariae]
MRCPTHVLRLASIAALGLALAACSTGTGSTGAETSSSSSAASSASSSGDAAPTGAAGEPIVIGIELPLSGASAAPAEQMRKGFELTAAEINDAGGVDGRPIELDIQDDAGDPTTGVALVDRFVQDGAVAIAGTYNSPVVLAQSEVIGTAEIPVLAFAISSQITRQQNPWVFQTGPTDQGQIAGIIERFKAEGLTKPALLTDTSAFGSTAKPVLEQALNDAGLAPVLSDTFAVDAADLSAALLKAKDSGADSVLAWTVGQPYATLALGAQQVGLGLPIIGTASAVDPAVARLAGDAADELYFQDAIDRSKPQVQELSERWAAEFDGGQVPSDALSAHDILTVITESLAESGPDRAALRDAMEIFSSDEMLSGRIGSSWTYSADNHVGLGGGNLVWKKYENGAVVTVDGQ